MQQLKRLFVLISLTIVLGACGGGGGGGGSTPANSTGASTPAGNNTNWNQLIWDQDNWN